MGSKTSLTYANSRSRAILLPSASGISPPSVSCQFRTPMDQLTASHRSTTRARRRARAATAGRSAWLRRHRRRRSRRRCRHRRRRRRRRRTRRSTSPTRRLCRAKAAKPTAPARSGRWPTARRPPKHSDSPTRRRRTTAKVSGVGFPDPVRPIATCEVGAASSSSTRRARTRAAAQAAGGHEHASAGPTRCQRHRCRRTIRSSSPTRLSIPAPAAKPMGPARSGQWSSARQPRPRSAFS